ncbi:hypothetical protein CEXT_248791 [Caerostris extrusa]|uniref:Uncharacterized protein n=1 Tax=Caerostris extrusa TaxID=172846 RepID=A0AAV4RX31_CAEEX|nr:hypothetical protein CEXT_248791 [Caerostris extrusa]
MEDAKCSHYAEQPIAHAWCSGNQWAIRKSMGHGLRIPNFMELFIRSQRKRSLCRNQTNKQAENSTLQCSRKQSKKTTLITS